MHDDLPSHASRSVAAKPNAITSRHARRFGVPVVGALLGLASVNACATGGGSGGLGGGSGTTTTKTTGTTTNTGTNTGTTTKTTGTTTNTGTNTAAGAERSCTGGLTCADGLSCCHSIALPAGSFAMGEAPFAAPEHSASVSAFTLDAFEVTVGRFRRFVEAYDGTPPAEGAGASPRVPGSGWQSAWNASLPASKAALLERVGCDSSFQTWTDTATTEEQIPMNCVDWFTAFAFCAWDGGRLPTEVEWEYAATGGSEDRLYPWGSADPSLLENEGLASDIYSDNSPFIPAGSHPSGNGRWGHRDLAGSLWEWTFDGYAAYTTAACDDCARVAASAKRVLRGGYWYNYKEYLPAAYRGAAPPTTLDSGYGFRCARSL